MEQNIPSSDLVAFNDYEDLHPVRVDLVYAQPQHKDNIFKTAIYRPDAKMWGHKHLAEIVLHAAHLCWNETGYIFEIKDCLRTTDAQARMLETDIVKANPQWLQEPGRLLSPPGKGGHPRGMAVDIVLIDEKTNTELDMGTPFDYLTTDRDNNPAARAYTRLSEEALKNRKLLEGCMMKAAAAAKRELLPLPQEWWDFRFPAAYTSEFTPISDNDLPADMRMT